MSSDGNLLSSDVGRGSKANDYPITFNLKITIGNFVCRITSNLIMMIIEETMMQQVSSLALP